MVYRNPLIAPCLTDLTTINDKGETVYKHDCHNTPICKSYGNLFFACLAGAIADTRCKRGEKMNIRILNDMNPNAIYKPDKPSKTEIDDYIRG